MIKNNLKCGFTLIELLVVILIIGILAAIALPKYNKAVEKSKYAETEELLQSIYGAQQRYYLVQNKYAESFDGLDITFPGTMEDDGISFITKNYKFSLEEISRGFVKAYRKRGDNSIYAIYKNLTNNKLYCEDLDTTDSITCNTFFGYTCWDFSMSSNGSSSGCPPKNQCPSGFIPPSRPGGPSGCRFFPGSLDY